MSRLQVGGLALLIHDEIESNIGKVVVLEKHYGGERYGSCTGKIVVDGWRVGCDDGFLMINGDIVYSACTASKNLMPLGDKQTQDELAKEVEGV